MPFQFYEFCSLQLTPAHDYVFCNFRIISVNRHENDIVEIEAFHQNPTIIGHQRVMKRKREDATTDEFLKKKLPHKLPQSLPFKRTYITTICLVDYGYLDYNILIIYWRYTNGKLFLL